MKAPEMFKIACEIVFKKISDGVGEGLHYECAIFYECDPTKNVECSGENCYRNGGECRKTERREYAKEKGVFE